jgi:transposase InsO family protein
LAWFDFYVAHGRNARLTCRHFGLSPDVFYRWKRRYNPRDLSTLEDDRVSRTPRHVRQPETDPALVKAVKRWREARPRWGKKKLWKLVDGEGYVTSISTVGRILTRLRAAGRLKEPAIVTATIAHRAHRRSRRNRPHAVRKPWDYLVAFPGDLVEIDTVHLTPFPGARWYQFTATDVVTKHTARVAASRITATAATRVLDAIQDRFPHSVQAIQIDGGSEFKAVFEAQCQRRGLQLFVLPPHSPKLNGQVERMQRTSREEIYDLHQFLTITELNHFLVGEDLVYNTIRPHDSLDLLTPSEYATTKFAGV